MDTANVVNDSSVSICTIDKLDRWDCDYTRMLRLKLKQEFPENVPLSKKKFDAILRRFKKWMTADTEDARVQRRRDGYGNYRDKFVNTFMRDYGELIAAFMTDATCGDESSEEEEEKPKPAATKEVATPIVIDVVTPSVKEDETPVKKRTYANAAATAAVGPSRPRRASAHYANLTSVVEEE
jgi:hypothetical protein